MQVNDKADGILFLSLISGRKAEMLIGKQVITAPILKQSSLEVLPTGYMFIDSGRATSASYMSNTTPIPAEKDAIAVCTAFNPSNGCIPGNIIFIHFIVASALNAYT